MRPRKSSTLVKKSQTLIKSKGAPKLQNFVSNHSQFIKESPNPVKVNPQIKSNLHKISTNTSSTFRRTFSTVKKNNFTDNKNIIVNQQTLNNKSTYSKANDKDSVMKLALNTKKQSQSNQSRIMKTTARNFVHHSLHKVAQTNNKALGFVNPQQNKVKLNENSRNINREKMFNTRKSKMESETKKKQIKEQEQSIKTPLKKSKNISIHPIKNMNTSQIKLEEKKREDNQQIQESNLIEQNKIEEIKIDQMPEQQSTSHHEQQANTNLSQIRQSQPNQTNIINHVSTNTQIEHNSFRLNQRQYPNNNINENEIQPNRQENPIIPVNERENEREYDLTSLVTNTQDIINFITRLNLRHNVQAFDLMVGQLTQLNHIAQQVQQLGRAGNNFGHSLVNVFGGRIRELQTNIINQVGQALIASFEQRIDPQFQALVIREPSLRQGFIKVDIEKTFEEKITFQEVECSICLDNVKPGDVIIQLQCYHQYHPICIKTWLQNSKKCPMCRKQQKLSQ